MKTMEVSVSPDMQFYNLLESYPYNYTSALCEYIDNALQAFLYAQEHSIFAKDVKLKIELDFNITERNSYIVIRDNGVGLSINDLQRALKPAYKPSEQSLSEFGIGMKAASLWFGRKWKLTSWPL